MSRGTEDDVRAQVRTHYAERATEQSSCCSSEPPPDLLSRGAGLGYTADEMTAVPQAAAMTYGCGNPQAIAALKPGEVVADLGSGGGLDCFLAARQVGLDGHVIGVDMTSEMIERARQNALSGEYTNVDFRLGEIEHLPIADATVDVVISNCVVNLAPDKRPVYAEAFRVLKPGGRLAIADPVAMIPIPDDAKADSELWSACASGALEVGEIESILTELGFEQISITPKDESRELIREWVPGADIQDYILSATIEAVKPR